MLTETTDTMHRDLPAFVSIAEPVLSAISNDQAVVALESTIITHGMAYPDNLETALAVETIIRNEGAVPATIAVLDGMLTIGLDESQISALSRHEGSLKLSRADLAFAISTKATGSTTVAATMMAAALAGIQLFATGGIGGVHRDARDSFDVSADLQELARTPVTVVSAGVKAILDIPATLEVLETLGVPVIGYRSNRFPGFWFRDSGIAAPLRLDDANDIATFMHVRKALGHQEGILVANPLSEVHALPRDLIETVISDALIQARDQNVKGKAVTPFLLSEIASATDGAALKANQTLIRENAALAAQIAHAVMKQQRGS